MTPPSDDWQDDVRSSLYIHFWCSWVSTSGVVVWTPYMTRQTWVRILTGSKFWFFRFRFFGGFGTFWGIYTHIWDENTSPTWSSGWALGHKPRGFWFDPESEVGSVEGDAPGTVGSWMRVLMKSRGRLTGLSSIYAFISFGLSQRKKTKFWYSTWACFLRHEQAFLYFYEIYNYNL
jgi:hypothetical protein